MQNPATDATLFWDNALPLRQATLTFAPKRLKEEWDGLKQQSALESLKEAAEQAKSKAPTDKPSLFEVIQPAQSILSARSKVLQECKEQLREHLKSGTLRSFAFEAPRTLASKALELSADTWQQHHNLDANSINFESLSFVEVRVISAKRAVILLRNNLSHAPTIKAGRPSFKTDIELAFATLLASNAINLGDTMTTHVPAIREWMVANTPNPKYGPDSPGYDLIRRTIKPLIEAERKLRADKL